MDEQAGRARRRELARANRDFLRSLCRAIKDCDERLRFVFLTGGEQVGGLGLNNLRDITPAPEFSDICGYTDDELDAVFAPELEGLDRDEIRLWYNGYNWRGPEKVYNPFGLLLLFRRREFRPYWFQTGTPTFLVETLTRRGLPTPDLDGMTGSEALLSSVDVDRALLFQTGYLTIAGEEDGGRRYRPGYPNLEMRRSLDETLLEELLPRQARKKAEELQLPELLEANDLERLESAASSTPPVVRDQPPRKVRGPLRERLPLPDARRRSRRTAATRGGPTWRYAPAGASTCSSSRW